MLEFSETDMYAVIGQLFMQKTSAENKLNVTLNFMREAALQGLPIMATESGFALNPPEEQPEPTPIRPLEG